MENNKRLKELKDRATPPDSKADHMIARLRGANQLLDKFTLKDTLITRL